MRGHAADTNLDHGECSSPVAQEVVDQKAEDAKASIVTGGTSIDHDGWRLLALGFYFRDPCSSVYACVFVPDVPPWPFNHNSCGSSWKPDETGLCPRFVAVAVTSFFLCCPFHIHELKRAELWHIEV